jgi:hypothetical protein
MSSPGLPNFVGHIPSLFTWTMCFHLASDVRRERDCSNEPIVQRQDQMFVGMPYKVSRPEHLMNQPLHLKHSDRAQCPRLGLNANGLARPEIEHRGWDHSQGWGSPDPAQCPKLDSAAFVLQTDQGATPQPLDRLLRGEMKQLAARWMPAQTRNLSRCCGTVFRRHLSCVLL